MIIHTLKIALRLLVLVIMMFPAAGCSHEPEEEDAKSEIPYVGATLTVSDQEVWTRNHMAERISQSYKSYYNEGRHIIFAVAFVPNPVYEPYWNYDPVNPLYNNPVNFRRYDQKVVGSGTITRGILEFSVDENFSSPSPAASNIKDALLEWKKDDPEEAARTITFIEYFYAWKNVSVSEPGVKGNVILLEAADFLDHDGDPNTPPVQKPVGVLDRQGMFGTKTTASCETILYVYVNKDCVISGETSSGVIPGQYYYRTLNNLNLSLKAGWNLVCRKETYGSNYNGHAIIAMEVRDPIKEPEKFRWVMELGFSF